MALIICPECGKSISDKSKFCINCGFPLPDFTDCKQHTYEPTRQSIKQAPKMPASAYAPRHSSPSRKKKKAKQKILLCVILVVLIIFIIATIGIIGSYKKIQEENRQIGQSLVDAAIEDRNNDARSAYYALLNSAQYGDVNFARYHLYDMDDDNTEELIVIAGTGEADAQIIVYDFEHYNKVVHDVGHLPGSHTLIYGSRDEAGLFLHYGHMGHEIISSVVRSGESLEVKEVLNQQTQNYSYFDNFVELAAYAINDFSPLGQNSAMPNSTQQKYEPQIGMTKDQVLDSTWGEPYDTSTVSSAYGTTEYWYYGDKAITFRNGIVEMIVE